MEEKRRHKKVKKIITMTV